MKHAEQFLQPFSRPFAQESSQRPHCIVVGGGFAGVSAAVRLVQAGVRVTLVETRSAAGGRVYSLEDRETGEVIDNGQHLLMGCYHHALHVLETLNTRSMLASAPAMKVHFADCTGKNLEKKSEKKQAASVFTMDAGRLPGKAGMALAMLMLKGLSVPERLQMLAFAGKLQLSGLYAFVQPANKTAFELLREHHQSERSIERLWEPIILATLNAHPKQAPASLLVEVLRRAFFADAESSRLLLARAGLAEVLAPFPAWLEQHGSRMITGTVAELLLKNRHNSLSGTDGVRLNSGEELFADAVISAVPPKALLKMLPETMRGETPFSRLSELPFSPILSLYLWFDCNFLDEDFIAMLGTETQWVFNRRRICNSPDEIVKRFPGHISLTISAAQAIDEPAITVMERCCGEIYRAFPRAQGAQLLRWRMMKEKFATPLFTPENEMLRPRPETAIHNFVLAGDWTDTKLPATIEGAAQSGTDAANAVLRVLR